MIIGHKIKELGYTPGLQPEADYFAIKMPVFSFEKIRGADISLGPEMKSTGECLGIAKTFDEALYKAFIGAGVKLPKHKNMIMTVRDEDKEEAVEIGRRFEKIGYKIREAQQVDRVPYMLVLGAKEAEAGNISVRDRKGETTTQELDAFINNIVTEIKERRYN